MKTAVALGFGFLSGGLIYGVVASNLGYDPTSAVSRPMAATVCVLSWFIAWGASAAWIIQNAERLSDVFRRGFLLGAVEWLATIPIVFLQSVGAMQRGTAANVAAIGIVGGFGMAVAMAFGCLICFAVAYLVGRESKEARKGHP